MKFAAAVSSSISNVSIGVYGRSFATTTSGSFRWQTFSGTGATPSNSVANSAPYEWYRGDATSAFGAGDSGVLLRLRAGPSSSALVVNRVAARATEDALFVALGEDRTDEELFARLPESAISLRVGPGSSCATGRVENVGAARAFLWEIVRRKPTSVSERARSGS